MKKLLKTSYERFSSYTGKFACPLALLLFVFFQCSLVLWFNSCKLKLGSCKGFSLRLANRSLLFSTVDIQLKEKSANSRPFSYSRTESESNDVVMQFEEFSNVHNIDGTSNTRLMPFRPLFPCVPWSRGTNNITLK